MASYTTINQEFIDLKFKDNSLRVYPFPPGMYDALISDILNKHPDPQPPAIEIKSFAGSEGKPETMEDLDDPEYIKAKETIIKTREEALSQQILGFILDECVEVLDTKKMNADIKRLSKYLSYPDDKVERSIRYISTYILKTQTNYSKIITTSLKLSAAGNKEVADRLDSFQDRLQRGEFNNSGSSSPKEKE